jgi:hypothetical protein
VTRSPGDLELDDISRDGRVLAAHHTTVNILAGIGAGELKKHDLSWLDGSTPVDLSPDGKTVVLTEAGEGRGSAPAVYLRGTHDSPAVRLGEGVGLALSPDGRWVLASAAPGEGKPEQLVLLPTGPGETIEGGDSRPIPGLEEADWPVQWSGDGHSLYVHKQDGIPNKIWLLDLASGKRSLFKEIQTGEPVAGLNVLLLTRDGGSYVYRVSRTLSELYVIEGLR